MRVDNEKALELDNRIFFSNFSLISMQKYHPKMQQNIHLCQTAWSFSFCPMHLTRSTGRILFCKTQQDMKPQMKLFVHLLTITSSFVFCGFSLLFRRKIEKTIDYKLEILFLQKKNALIGINKFSSFHQF